METERFRNYDKEVQELVQEFEKLCSGGGSRFFDTADLCTVIDFYLEENDVASLERAVLYAVELYPRSVEVRMRKAYLLSVKGRYEQALRLLKSLEAESPDNTDVLYAMGTVYSAMDQPRTAIRYYRMASRDGRELGMVYANIGDEYCQLDNFQEAVRYYKKSVGCNPDDDRTLYNLYYAYADDGRESEAADYFARFVEEHPYSASGWYCQGLALMDMGLYEKAVDSFEYVLAIDDRLYEGYARISECYRELRDYAKAAAYLRDSLKCAPDPSIVQFDIGMIYHSMENYSTAVIYFKKAAEESADFADAWMAAADCYSLMGDYGSAVDNAVRAFALNPQSSLYAWQLARIHQRFAYLEEAEKFYLAAIRLDEENDEARLDYSDLLIALERYADAAEVLEEGVVRAVETFDFNIRLVHCYYHTGARAHLFNAVRACKADPAWDLAELIRCCPELEYDLEVMNVINGE